MARTLDTLEHDALLLPEDQRLTLAHRLLQSTEPATDPALESLWTAEIVRRIESLDSGTTQIHDASDVFRDLDRRLAR
jgi:hypothetical protein